jgi:uncharacterized protein YndB with AHSA1/START domain
MSKTRSVEKTIQVRADRKAVWKALTEGEQIARWFAPEARSTPGKDGRIIVSWGPGMEAESRISVWEPERHLQTLPGQKSEAGVALTLDYYLEGEGGSTTLRLVHSGFVAEAAWDEEYDSYERGWAIFMLNLKHYLDRHAGQPCVQAMFTGELKGSREETWPKVLRALGFEAKSGSPRPGDAFRISAAGIDGTLDLYGEARDIAGVVPSLNDGLFRLSLEKFGLYGVLLTYDLPAERSRSVTQKLEAAIRAIS